MAAVQFVLSMRSGVRTVVRRQALGTFKQCFTHRNRALQTDRKADLQGQHSSDVQH